MSTTTIQFTLLKNGVAYNATSVSVPAGITRTDTGAVVVTAGTNNFTHVSTGVYSFAITDPAPGLTYSYTIVSVVDTLTFEEPGFITGALGLPTALYWTYAQFQKRWGNKNIAIASNKDIKSTDGDYAAVQDAFDYAVDELHNAQRGGLIKVPFDFTPWSGVIPPVISRWGMIIAYADLYDVRGWEDKSTTGNKLSTLLKSTYQDMSMYKSGLKQLDIVAATDFRGNSVDQHFGTIVNLGGWTNAFYGTNNLVGWPLGIGYNRCVPDGCLTWFISNYYAA